MKDKKNFFANGVKDARKAKEEIKRINEKRQKEGNSRWTPLTEEQLNKIQGMGIKIEGEKSNIVDEFIEKIEKLQEIGVDVSKIVRSDTILKLVGKTIEESEEILIKKIKGMGLEPDYNIGSKLSDLKKVYNKNQRGEKTGGTIATEEQVRRIRSFGIKIGKEITGQSIGQASYTATVQECDEAQAELNKLLDKQKNQQEV